MKLISPFGIKFPWKSSLLKETVVNNDQHWHCTFTGSIAWGVGSQEPWETSEETGLARRLAQDHQTSNIWSKNSNLGLPILYHLLFLLYDPASKLTIHSIAL